MLYQEFCERTNFEPTPEEYEEIERLYYKHNIDKDEFCRLWIKNHGKEHLRQAMSGKIAELRTQLETQEIEAERQVNQAKDEIHKLQEQLDKELQWKPYEKCGTQMSEEDYQHLVNNCSVMTEEAVKNLLYTHFGFAQDQIKLILTVATYEINKYHQLRKVQEYDRKPLYFASDWNYIRFDCGCMRYELINGDLMFYED